MALRGSRIENFDELWCLGASGGLDFCVSSTSFQKNNIGWHQLVNETENSKLSEVTRHHNSSKFLILLPLRAI